MKSVAVIGKNFGDEGKGLVTASLCFSCPHPLIIKHNGGAQAGHTVESVAKGIRFVHHQTGSGSEHGAPTLFAASYHPDLFQLGNEITDFENTFHFIPRLYSEADTQITTIDDVLLNMALETERGAGRHGSCGMGIYECTLRGKAKPGIAASDTKAIPGTISASLSSSGDDLTFPDSEKHPYSLTVREVKESNGRVLLDRLRFIREEYTQMRIRELGIGFDNPYFEMLNDENVLANFAKTIKENSRYVEIINADRAFLEGFDTVIFETGQGLLLDEDNERFTPHVTASKTGVCEPVRFLEKRGLLLDEAFYVTRPYVTRHGAGLLPEECSISELPNVGCDRTNITNKWQGSIRYARHESIEEFLRPVKEDLKKVENSTQVIKPSLVITHMDETEGRIYFKGNTLALENLSKDFCGFFTRIYISSDRECIR